MNYKDVFWLYAYERALKLQQEKINPKTDILNKHKIDGSLEELSIITNVCKKLDDENANNYKSLIVLREVILIRIETLIKENNNNTNNNESNLIRAIEITGASEELKLMAALIIIMKKENN